MVGSPALLANWVSGETIGYLSLVLYVQHKQNKYPGGEFNNSHYLSHIFSSYDPAGTMVYGHTQVDPT